MTASWSCRHGEIVAEFDRENATQYEIGLAATGVTAPTVDEPDLDDTEPVGRSAQALEHLVEPGQETATVSPKPNPAPAKSVERASPPTEPPPPTRSQREWLKRLLGRRETGLLAALLVIIVPLSILNPRFLSGANLVDLMLVETSLIGIVAIGQLMVMLTRQIDLSVASIIGLTGYIAASTMAANQDLPVFVGILIACGVGLLCGAINGVIVAYGKVPSIVVTLGTLAIYRGVDSILSAGKQVGSADVPEGWLAFTAAKPLGISILIWIGLVVFLIAGGFLWKTSQGTGNLRHRIQPGRRETHRHPRPTPCAAGVLRLRTARRVRRRPVGLALHDRRRPTGTRR